MELLETIGISLLSAGFASFLAYYFGFRQYLKQKEREKVNEVYIENGIDRVIEILDKSCFICRFNHAKAIRIIEYLEKSLGDINIERNITQKIFSEMEPLVVAPENSIYKLEILTGKDKILSSFTWIIKIIADYLRYNDYLRYELFFELEHYFKHPEKFKGDKSFLKELQKRVVDIYEDVISKNEMMKVYLLNIKIRIDEIGISSMKDLKKISRDEKIKEILEKIQEDYKKIDDKEKKCQENMGK